MFSLKTLLATAAMLSLAQAKTVTVTATDNDSFDPSSVEADEGDTVEFRFDGGNHSVVAGEYDWPCSPLQLGTGFFSGFVEGDDDKVFRVKINNTEPIAFYSSVGQQCPDGMVGIINPGRNATVDEYRDGASELSSGVTPSRDGEPFGGQLVDEDEDDGNDDNDDDKDDDGNENSNSNNNNDDDADDDDDDGNAAGSFGVPAISLAAAVGIAFFMA